MSFDVIASLIILAVPLFAGTALIVDGFRRAVAEARPVSHPNYHLRRPTNPSRFRECSHEFTIGVRSGGAAF
jgi:hypothetical protein